MVHPIRAGARFAGVGGEEMKPVAVFSAVVFLVIAIAHLVRVVLRVPVVAGGVAMPLWPSAVIAAALIVLAALLLREARR